MWTALGQHATVLLVIAGLLALVATEFVLLANGVLQLPAADLAKQDVYLWSLYVADADPYAWAAYVAPEHVALAGDDRYRQTERATS